MSMTVKIEGLEELQARMRQPYVRDAALRVMKKATALVHHEIAKYPPQQTGRTQPLTQRQRRYLFWAVRSGLIQIPYRRTGQLGRGWMTREWSTGDNVAGEIKNTTTYGPLVQGQQQTAFHKGGGWQMLTDAVKKHMGQITEFFRQVLIDFSRNVAG